MTCISESQPLYCRLIQCISLQHRILSCILVAGIMTCLLVCLPSEHTCMPPAIRCWRVLVLKVANKQKHSSSDFTVIAIAELLELCTIHAKVQYAIAFYPESCACISHLVL